MKLNVSILIAALCPGNDEADVTVQHHRLDLQIGVERYDDGEHLSRGDDSSDRVHCQLLHDAVNRCGENLLLRLLFSLDHVLGKTRGSLFGFREIVVERPDGTPPPPLTWPQ